MFAGKKVIPSTKLNPKDILPILEIVQKNEGDIKAMKKDIYAYLLNASERGRIIERNAIYALALPTLKRLNLLKGKGENIHLDVDGQILLKTYKMKGINEYHRQLAKVILRADMESANVLESIKDLGKEQFTKKELIEKLITKGVETSINDDRLYKWLRIIEYVRFIDNLDGSYVFNKYQLEAIKKESANRSSEVFFEKLLKAYQKLTKERRGNPYIPIPEIEKEVCSQLTDEGFTTFDFRQKLIELRGKEINGFTLTFSKPGARESKGLKINDEYYYYIAIFGGRSNGIS